MKLVTVEAIENVIDGLTDKPVSKGGKYKMYEDMAKEYADLGVVKLVEGNPDIEEKPKREVGVMTANNVKAAEPVKLTSVKEDVKEEETKVSEVKEAKPKKI